LSLQQYQKGPEAKTTDGKESAWIAAGDHWTVFTGTMSLSKDKETITFQAFDMNEGLQTKTMNTAAFKDMVNHVLLIERKPEK
jgi:hypothetical protein